ncbi:MAG: YdcF family protein [Gammaproteobacteria bacterium]|nr:YdcF family protein [Gammaproteobacteria bacterium]
MFSTIANILTIPILYPLLMISLGLYHLRNDNLVKAKFLFGLSLLLLIVFTQPLIATIIIRPLENVTTVKDTDTKGESTIVVMACNYRHEETIPFESRWNKCSTDRLLRAIDIHNNTKNKVIVAGGNFGNWPNAYSHYAKLFLSRFGVNKKHIIEVPMGHDSESEIKAILAKLPTNNVTLITSASHMKRARFFFEMCEKSVTSVATDYLSLPSSTLEPSLPSAESLAIIKRAFHEYLGIIEQTIKRELGEFDEYCHNVKS